MKHTLNKISVSLLIMSILFYGCKMDSNPKKALFETTMESECTFVCVRFVSPVKDTIIFCGDKYKLFEELKPNIGKQEFYIQCSESSVNPIIIDSAQLQILLETKSAIYMHDINRKRLYNNETNIDIQTKEVLDYLNTHRPLSEDILIGIYQCWLHNIIITTSDEVGPNHWFSYSLE